jgi:hypothetical protein
MKCLKCEHDTETPNIKEAYHYEAQVILEHEVIVGGEHISFPEILFCGVAEKVIIGICERCGAYNFITRRGKNVNMS